MKKKLILSLLFLLFVLFIAIGMVFLLALGVKSFDKIEGNGVIKEQTKDLGSIDKIVLGIDAEVTLIESKDKNFIVIKGDENIVESLSISDGKTLKVNYPQSFPYLLGRSYKPSQRITIEIHFDNIKELQSNASLDIKLTEDSKTISNEGFKIKNNGSGSIALKVSTKDLTIENNGSGDILVKGETDKLKIDSNGSGNVDTNDLESQEVEVSNNGSGKVTVYAETELSIKINGSGDVVYSGGAKDFEQDVNGSGSVIKK